MKNLKVTLYSKYSRMGASSRLRSLQYLPLLAQMGIDVEVYERFSKEYLVARYNKNRWSLVVQVGKSYWRRFAQLSRRNDNDLVWLEGELFPKIPYWLESVFLSAMTPYVVDYDDALFHNYDLAKNPLVRYVLGQKIDKVMRNASCVVAGNEYLAKRATQAGAKRIEIIPTVVDHRRYATVTHAERIQTVIGWIGSPSTQKYLLNIREALRQVCEEHHIKLLLIGASAQISEQLPGLPIEILPWTEASEANSIGRMDIGVMPLTDGPWERGKCGYKLIQYMACGLPVVASPVGANTEIVRQDINGFLAASTATWRESLSRLVKDVSLRESMGRAGRELVEQKFSLEAQAPRLADVFHRVVAHERDSF